MIARDGIAARMTWRARRFSTMRDQHLAAEPGRRAALRLMRRFRLAVLALGIGGVGAGLIWHSKLLLGLAFVITIEEMLEGSVVIAVLKGSGRSRAARCCETARPDGHRASG